MATQGRQRRKDYRSTNIFLPTQEYYSGNDHHVRDLLFQQEGLQLKEQSAAGNSVCPSQELCLW